MLHLYCQRSYLLLRDPPDLMYHVGPVCEIRGHVTPVPVSVPPTSPYRSMVSEAAYHPAKSEPPELPHLWVSTKFLHGWASSNIWQKQRQLRGRNIKHQCKCSLTANKIGLNQWTSFRCTNPKAKTEGTGKVRMPCLLQGFPVSQRWLPNGSKLDEIINKELKWTITHIFRDLKE